MSLESVNHADVSMQDSFSIFHDYYSLRNNLLYFITHYSLRNHNFLGIGTIRDDIRKFVEIPDSEASELNYAIGFFLKELNRGNYIRLINSAKKKKYEVLERDV